MRRAGVPAIPEVAFAGVAKPTAAALMTQLGPQVVLKPADKGSSVGLYVVDGEGAIAAALAQIPLSGQWMAERRLLGREMSIGILGGQAMGLVEIVPRKGVYDYQSKYTKARRTISTRPRSRPNSPRVFSPRPRRSFRPVVAATSPGPTSFLNRTGNSIS